MPPLTRSARSAPPAPPAPPASPPPRTRPIREDLVIRAMGPQGSVQLLTSSVHYKIIEAILDMALSLLETDDCQKSLVQVAKAVIDTRNASLGSRSRAKHHIYKDSMARMPFWVRQFLAALRRDFPPIYLEEEVEGEAAVEKAEWGSQMEKYDPTKAADFFLSEAIINNMAWVRTLAPDEAGDSYDIFKFQMVISVAHEIVHLLVGFLTGKGRPDTPDAITGPGYGDSKAGESGRYWEDKFLGGYLECWSVKDHALDHRQPGLPYLFKSGPRATTTGQRVSATYITDFLKGTLNIPIAVSTTHTEVVTRDELKARGSSETTKLRNSKKHKGAVQKKPPPVPNTAAEATVRYRSITTGPGYGLPQGRRPEWGYSR